jgi:hypothetical protein
MARTVEDIKAELHMLKAREAELEAMLAAPVAVPVAASVAVPVAAPVGDEPAPKRRKPSPPTGLHNYVYRYGVRLPGKVPIRKTFGVVTTLRETLYDHVSIRDGRLYLMVADDCYPATDVQVKHILRSSKKPDAAKARLFPMLDIYSKGVRVGTVRSKADLLRRLGVDVPKVYSCCKVAPA